MHSNAQEASGTDREQGVVSGRAELGALVRLAASQYDAALSRALTGSDISPDQWMVIEVLSRSEGASMSEIAAAVSVPAPSAKRLVDRLVDAALVYRSLDGLDARRVIVQLSARGHDVRESLAPEVTIALEEWCPWLRHWEVSALIGMLKSP